jgi:multiple antibiotic resistance protein
MLEMFIKDFLVLWATIDPVGALALFVGLTSGHSKEERKQIAKRAVTYAGVVLIFTVFIGQVILAGMGIRLISLQVAGGIVLFLFSLQMIFVHHAGPAARLKRPEEGHDIAVFPLAIPAIATPGAIMAAILLTDNNYYSFPQQALTTFVLVIVLVITYYMLLFSENVLHIIGRNGATILVKVMGMLLAALSVELIMEAIGIERWLQ